MRALFLAVSLLGWGGCSASKSDDTSAAMLGTCERPQHGLTDLSRDFEPWDCDVQQSTGTAGPGATSFFYGVYSGTGSTYSGYEEWHLFVNETLAGSGESNCIMRWSAEAVPTDPVSCTSCDLALEVALTLDEGCSTCPDYMLEPERGTSFVTYEIMQQDGSTNRWFFSDSTNEFGSGTYNGAALNFETPRSCRWF